MQPNKTVTQCQYLGCCHHEREHNKGENVGASRWDSVMDRKKLYTDHLLADIFHTGIFRYLFITDGVTNDPRSFENIVTFYG